MRRSEVLIIGGGPAGSSCAWALMRLGIDCLLLDQHSFPRDKLCAGWITPEVVRLLEMDLDQYPHRLLSLEKMKVGVGPCWLPRIRMLQYSIRRCEFDHWLLERSQVKVEQHRVAKIERSPQGFIVDQRFSAQYIVGAGGTRCPVYRGLFKKMAAREHWAQVVAMEDEFPYAYDDGQCYLNFFVKGLPGYGWYVPKENGFLNIGIGGMASQLKLRQRNIKEYWDVGMDIWKKRGLLGEVKLKPKAYSYHVRGGQTQVEADNAYLIGDAAGLASRDLCEGIGPAVSSGIYCAQAIAGLNDYTLDRIAGYSIPNTIVRKLLEHQFITKSQQSNQVEAIPH